MHILVLNGSPRKGNIYTAVNAFAEAVDAQHTVEIVDVYKLNVAPCMGCNACQCANGCVHTDDSNAIVDKIVAADIVVFASPVYWWGITAQLKLVLDKCYCRGASLGGKKAGLIVIGGDKPEHVQYKLIQDQFHCIEDYLGWKFLFMHSFSASATDDLAKNQDAMKALQDTAKAL